MPRRPAAEEAGQRENEAMTEKTGSGQSEPVRIKITDMSERGQGIGRVGNLVVFVDGALYGDTVTARWTKKKKRFALATTISVDEPSPWRVTPDCPQAAECGGCMYAALSPAGQIRLKEQQVRDKLVRLGGFADPPLRPMVPAPETTGFRNKAVLRLAGRSVGFLRQGSREVVDCPYCPQQTPAVTAAAQAVRDSLAEFELTAEDLGLSAMTVRTAFGTGEVMVILRTETAPDGAGTLPAAEREDALEELIYRLDEAVYKAGFSLESVVAERAGSGGANADGEREYTVLAGRDHLRDQLGNLDLEVSPASFYQINPAMTVRMYDCVKDFAALTGEETVLDLYCGAGSIGLWCAEDAAVVLGIEAGGQAVRDANRNAVINGIVNARYLQGAAEEVLPRLLRDRDGEEAAAPAGGRGAADPALLRAARQADAAILDPPRAGCRPALLQAVLQVRPERIIYMSCDPATLARDLRQLAAGGYALRDIVPFDNFCGSRHVETVSLLSRRDIG